MGQKELIQRILKEETIIPIGARRNLNQLDDYYEYYDDHALWKYQTELRERIKRLEDENKIWILQELSKISL